MQEPSEDSRPAFLVEQWSKLTDVQSVGCTISTSKAGATDRTAPKSRFFL